MPWRAERRRPGARRLALASALALLAATACGPRYVRETVADDGGLTVLLRAEVRSGQRVGRDYSHPATISGVRIAHILSRLDVRLSASEEGGERKPAIATDLLYDLGDLLSQALAKADPSQEVVVQALRKERRFGLFTEDYYTSFVAYVKGDDLYIHLSRVDDLIAKGEEKSIREPYVNKEVQAFRVLASEGVLPVAAQAVAVDWRNPVFRSPTNVRVGPGGKVERRTILMESPAPLDEEAPAADLAVPDDPEVLRALVELEEARRDGAISEVEYQQRRRDLLREAAPGR